MNDLTQLLERATDDLQPDVPTLVAGATARGRRLRTRRRVTTGLGAIAAVAAVGGVALTAPAFIGSSGRSDVPFASQRTPSSAPARATADLPTVRGLTSGRVVKVPSGSTLVDSWGGRDRGFVAASWRVTPDDGSGPGQIQILVEYADSRFHDDASSTKDGKSLDAAASKHSVVAANPCAEAVGRCVRLAGGSYLSTFTAPEPLSGGGDSVVIGAHAELWTAGLHLSAVAYNSMGEKDTATTRETPVLTDDQLGALLRTFGAH